jgi:hypothetical protein
MRKNAYPKNYKKNTESTAVKLKFFLKSQEKNIKKLSQEQHVAVLVEELRFFLLFFE